MKSKNNIRSKLSKKIFISKVLAAMAIVLLSSPMAFAMGMKKIEEQSIRSSVVRDLARSFKDTLDSCGGPKENYTASTVFYRAKTDRSGVMLDVDCESILRNEVQYLEKYKTHEFSVGVGTAAISNETQLTDALSLFTKDTLKPNTPSCFTAVESTKQLLRNYITGTQDLSQRPALYGNIHSFDVVFEYSDIVVHDSKTGEFVFLIIGTESLLRNAIIN